nr:hypothetical protein [Tanacetum cinerariifolium]
MSKTIKISKSKAFVGVSWSDSDEHEKEKTKDEKCLMAKASNEVTKMPKATTTDISLTKSYIPKVSKIPGISATIAQFYKPIENCNIHECRIVDQAYYKSYNIERFFTNIRLNCLFQINEPIVSRFILDFYIQWSSHFTNEWDLASIEYSQETEGPYCTDLPTSDEICRLLELERVVVDRTIKCQTVALNPNQILTKELSLNMKQWEELIRENVFGLGGHQDRLPAYLAHMLYCVVVKEQYNLAYFFVKRIECARATPTANLPYGMFLTRLYRYFMETDVEESARSIKILSTIDPKDKGKGIMQEPEKPLKNPRMAQIQLDEELAKRMHEEEMAKFEKRQSEIAAEEANRAVIKAAINQELDNIQAMIETDEQMASRLQYEEQEQFTIEELLNSFTRLESLSLGHCFQINDSDLTPLLKHGSELRYLHLNFCRGVTDLGLSYVASGCKLLKEVNLACCINITDHGIRSLNQNCRQLRSLNILGCDKVTGVSFYGFSSTLACLEANNCAFDSMGVGGILSGGGLEYLNLHRLQKRIDGNGLEAIGLGLASNLKILNFYMCNFVEEAAIIEISRGCPLLQE